MKTHIPLDRLKRSRDSGSALYNMHPTDVLGRAGGGGGAKKTSRAITAREAKNHSYKLFGEELHNQRNSTNSN